MQGLTASKGVEITGLMESDKPKLVCLVETHQTRDNLHMNSKIKYLAKYRTLNDTKGGGVLLLWNEKFNFRIVEINTENPDILEVSVNIDDLDFTLVITYLSTNNEERN